MLIETSALVSIMLEEPAAPALRQAMLKDPTLLISSMSILEAGMVLTSRRGEAAGKELLNFVEQAGVKVISFDQEHALVALEAWLKYGKGHHPAGLNFGDCCSYAVAKLAREPLLYIGADFSKMDIARAI